MAPGQRLVRLGRGGHRPGRTLPLCREQSRIRRAGQQRLTRGRRHRTALPPVPRETHPLTPGPHIQSLFGALCYRCPGKSPDARPQLPGRKCCFCLSCVWIPSLLCDSSGETARLPGIRHPALGPRLHTALRPHAPGPDSGAGCASRAPRVAHSDLGLREVTPSHRV